MSQVNRTIVAVFVALLIAGCGVTDGTGNGTDSRENGEFGSKECSIQVGEPISESWAVSGPSDVPAWSLYWSPGVSGPDSVLSFSCNAGPDRSLALEIVGASSESDFPFGPGIYQITPGNHFWDEIPPEPGQVKVAVLTPGIPWNVIEGTLTIDTWDSGHIAGHIDLSLADATDPQRTAPAEVSFDIPCQGTVCG